MLPCNVTVEQHEGGVLVSMANPEMMLSVGQLGENDHLMQVAAEARARLQRVQTALSK
jgi:hypothetical protein